MQQSTPTELMVSMEIAVRYLCVEIHDYFFFFFDFNGVIKNASSHPAHQVPSLIGWTVTGSYVQREWTWAVV